MCGHAATGGRNFILAPLNYTLLTVEILWNLQIVHLYEHLNPLKGVFSDKPLIIAVIQNFQFAYILDELHKQQIQTYLSNISPMPAICQPHASYIS